MSSKKKRIRVENIRGIVDEAIKEFAKCDSIAKVRQLKRDLMYGNSQTKENAMILMGELEFKHKKSLIPCLVDILISDCDSSVCAKAGRKLAEMGRYSVPYLIERFSEGRDTEYSKIIDVLEMIGKEAVDPLISLLRQTGSYKVKIYCVIALGRIGWEARSATPLLLSMLSDPTFDSDYGIIRYALYKVNNKLE